MDLGLKDKVAVITGGSVGIGLAIARGLAAEGVHLTLCARDRERLAAEARAIEQEFGVRAQGVAADVSKAGDIARLVEEVQGAHGGCDILINNAGTGSNETIMEAPDDKWQQYWDLHVMAAVRLARGLVPMMQAQGGGVILNNASICAAQPLWYEPIYNVTKAALVMLSKNLANELIPHNIRVNALNLGLVLTPDWIKTAKQLTAEQRRALGELHRRHRQGARADRPLRLARGGRQLLRVPVLGAGELQRRRHLLCRRRHAEGGRLRPAPPDGVMPQAACPA